MTPNTAMASAFAAAGIPSADERLIRVGVDAWAKFPGASGDTARRGFVADQLRGEMTYSLLNDYDKSGLGAAVAWLLMKSEKAIVAQRPVVVKAAGGGQSLSDTQPSPAPANQSRDAAATQRSAPATMLPAPKAWAPAAPKSNLTALADKQAARAAARIATEIKLSRLDTFKINGRPIGECTAAEANGWASSRERDARFVRMLTANLPPGRPIKEFVRGEDADALYQRAEADNAA